MSDRFTFVGHEPSYGYMHYRDLDTGCALVAEHGQSYRIAATEGPLVDEAGNVLLDRYPVPPADGRWAAVNSAEGKAAKARARAAGDAGGDDAPPDSGGDTGVPDGASGSEGGE